MAGMTAGLGMTREGAKGEWYLPAAKAIGSYGQ
jgi:hypothetical protein